MKSNNDIVGGELNPDSYADFANYLKSFADYMSNNDAPLYAVSVQNEPDVHVGYESCDWNAEQMLNFVKNNAPAVGTKIIAPESYKFDHAMSDPILNDPVAAANVSIIGGHLYAEGALASYPLALSKGKEIWQTEHIVDCYGMPGAFDVAKEINDCMNAGMSAYLLWYIRRFYGPMDEEGNITKGGYFMSQYARFVRPGFYRVSVTAHPQNNIDITAYKNGSSIVIVALNEASTSISQTFIIQNGFPSAFTPYVTSASENCVKKNDIAVSDGKFTAGLDPMSVTTFVSN
jgi:glucuronoarabinoxylan endo-1,4-beta-xylanase